MNTTASSFEIAYGSVWLVSAGAGDSRHLSPPAAHALGAADAVIHDLEIPDEILERVKPPRYREAALPGRAIERSIKLARDGWRVVYLVAGDAMERAIECGTRFAERNIPFRIAPTAGEPLTSRALIGLLLVHKLRPVGGTETGPLFVFVANPQSGSIGDAQQRQAPLSFSMSGLAG
jgi:siroheme synthase